MKPTARSPERLYDSEFHADRDVRTRATARKVLGALKDLFYLDSICDVGCGTGTWLGVAQELGFGIVAGFEGPWARTANLVVDPDVLVFQDLEEPVRADRQFDLVLSLEVAEHLPESRSGSFVRELCALGDCVIFSAAIPMQGGTGHINERWQSYWARLFERQGFAAYDPIRPLIWNEPEIPFWYRQNMLLYVREGTNGQQTLQARGFQPAFMIDLVHPEQYLKAETSTPRRAIERLLKSWLNRS